jgi:dipeptidyl aminopeptidase/acylaminoacyl peptidase
LVLFLLASAAPGNAEAPRRLTKINPQVDTWKLPKISTVAWKGARGDSVEGILELPPDYRPGQKLPLVVEIHGGPTTASYFQLQYWIYGRTLLPARGYALLSPNYRGSTGYGDRFITDLIGHENELDVEDILKGVDALVKRGIADPKRLGVMGWSNGGYLTNCLISRTTRFKAASSGAGIVDTVMEWGANDEPAYMNVFMQGFPWSRPRRYRKASSTYDLHKIRTPTLIHVGGNDERCPPPQSRMLYRALKEYVRVPTELLVYPGEPHGLMKYKNRRAKMVWDLAWFDRYLLGKKGK